jgi:hypothetical protein
VTQSRETDRFTEKTATNLRYWNIPKKDTKNKYIWRLQNFLGQKNHSESGGIKKALTQSCYCPTAAIHPANITIQPFSRSFICGHGYKLHGVRS